jgi:hypothetical protein
MAKKVFLIRERVIPTSVNREQAETEMPAFFLYYKQYGVGDSKTATLFYFGRDF